MEAVVHICSKRAKEQRSKYCKDWNKAVRFGNAEGGKKKCFHNLSLQKLTFLSDKTTYSKSTM